MKKVVLALLALAIPLAGCAGPLNLYVASDGSDAGAGSLWRPYATLERARDEIRHRKAAGTIPPGPITVHVRGGIYPLDRTFELTKEDAGTVETPVVYRAYAAEKVHLIGGREVTSFTPVTEPAILARLDGSARGHVYQADLKAVGITDLGKVAAAGERIELFFLGKPMRLARWPNEGFVEIKDVVGSEPHESHGIKGNKEGKFTYDGDRPSRWKQEKDIWLHGYWFWNWADAYQQVQSIDTDNRVICTVPPYHHYGYRPGARFYALNLLCEIDTPGEWYLDRDVGMLYFWPPGSFADSSAYVSNLSAYVSTLGDVISMKEASHVELRGLTIEFNRGTAIRISDGSHNRVAACTIRSIGGAAVAVAGGRYHEVIGCDIYDTGDGGISLTGGDRNTLVPCHHLALNNHIYRYSRTSQTYRTGVSVHGVGCRVAHNLIHDAPHMAIGLSGNEHVIELNEIHTVCMDTDDAGAFYMGRDWTWRGNVIRYNYFHHIGQFEGRVGVQSIYLDDWASGTIVFGNVCHRGGRGVLLGGGRDNVVVNNVFVDCKPAVHVDSRGLGWAKSYFDSRDNTLTERLKAIPYRQPPWSYRYPELLTLYEDAPAVAKGNVVARNICVGGRWLDLHNALTGEIVRVKDNLVNVDPGFVDADHGNYQLKDDSPAFALEFARIPFERIGLYDDPLRASPPESKR